MLQLYFIIACLRWLWKTAQLSVTYLRNRRKGMVKTSEFYKGKDYDVYLSHVKVQITVSRKDIYLILVYGITEYSMALAINRKIKSIEDIIRVARTYFLDGKSKNITAVKCRYFNLKTSCMEALCN